MTRHNTHDSLGRVEFFRDDEARDFDRMKRRLLKALRKLETYVAALDTPLVEEIAHSAIYAKRGEHFLDDPNCSAATYTAVSDAMAKHASRMRAAIKELAASRAERLKFQPASRLAAEIKSVVDRVIQEG